MHLTHTSELKKYLQEKDHASFSKSPLEVPVHDVEVSSNPDDSWKSVSSSELSLNFKSGMHHLDTEEPSPELSHELDYPTRVDREGEGYYEMEDTECRRDRMATASEGLHVEDQAVGLSQGILHRNSKGYVEYGCVKPESGCDYSDKYHVFSNRNLAEGRAVHQLAAAVEHEGGDTDNVAITQETRAQDNETGSVVSTSDSPSCYRNIHQELMAEDCPVVFDFGIASPGNNELQQHIRSDEDNDADSVSPTMAVAFDFGISSPRIVAQPNSSHADGFDVIILLDEAATSVTAEEVANSYVQLPDQYSLDRNAASLSYDSDSCTSEHSSSANSALTFVGSHYTQNYTRTSQRTDTFSATSTCSSGYIAP